MGWEDPIVKETRARRKAYAKPFKHDLDAVFQDIRTLQGQSGRKVVAREPRRPEQKRHVAQGSGAATKRKKEDQNNLDRIILAPGVKQPGIILS